jgi:DNA repair photolyase
MIKEIQAKTLLSRVRQPDTWFGLRYNMNLYRGCQHRCIYCDSRSECYQIENFDGEVLVKANAPELLRKELASKRIKGTIGTGSMNDPYMPLEATTQLTRRALEAIADFRFPVHIITKSDLVLRDADLLAEIAGQSYAAVTFTITTASDALGKKLEPGAPEVSRRFKAMLELSWRGILTGVSLMPLLPFIEDNEENIVQILSLACESGASYVIPSFGMTLRDRQRDYYYRQLDRLFPDMSGRYRQHFGEQYFAPANRMRELEHLFEHLCGKYGLATRIPQYEQEPELEQLSLM